MKTIIIDELDNFGMNRIMTYLYSGHNYPYVDEGIFHGNYVKADDIIDREFVKSGSLDNDSYKNVNFKIMPFIKHSKKKEEERQEVIRGFFDILADVFVKDN